MHRSKLFKLLIALLALTMFATACGGSDDESSSSSDSSSASEATESSSESSASEAAEEAEEAPAEEEEAEAPIVQDQEESVLEPVFGGTLRWGLEAEVDGINPTASALSAPGLTMMNAVFDTLAAYDVDGNTVPHLAESFTASADCKTWSMKLRSGITFHDGTPLNTEAVSVNFLAQFGDPLVGLAVRPYHPADEPITIVDDLNMNYHLIDANCGWPSALTGQLGAVASPTWIAAAQDDPTLDQQPVGTGPFIFESRVQDQVTRFVKNANWWGGDVYLDAVEFYPVTDGDIRTSLLLEGELDAQATTNVESIASLAENDSITQVLDDTGDESFLMLNSAKAPFDDIRARQAITHATPRDNYNTLINLDVTRKADQMFTPESPYYNPDVVQLSDRPDLAGPLVNAYCADNPSNCTGGKIDIEYQYSGPSVVGERIADLLSEGWADFFNVTVQVLPQDAHIQEAALGVYNSIGWRQFGAVDPGIDRVWLMCRAIGGISLNWPRYCDEDRDALILQADAATSTEEKIPLYQELSQKINEDYLYVFYHHTLWSLALRDGVENVCGAKTLEGATLRCQVNGRSFFQSTFLAD